MDPIKKLIVFGTKETGSDGSEIYHLEPPARDAVNKHDVGLEDKIIELELDDDDGTTWMCDAATLHEVYPELHPALRSPADRGDVPDEFVLPIQINSESSERGVIGKIVVKLLKVFAKKKLDEGVESIARRLEDKHLLQGLSEKDKMTGKALDDYLNLGAGLFLVDTEFNLKPFNNYLKDQKYFIFIHGTNSNTVDAFEDLKNSSAWSTIHNSGYPVLAFQHRTLTERPLENVLKLAEMLPEGADLHLLSHSRGGIIGDILNKYSVTEGNPLVFTEKHIERLADEGDRESDIRFIKKLNQILPAKKIIVSRFVRVACPAAGTVLASKRLDHMLNVLFNLMGGVFGDILKELLMYAVDHKNQTDVLPGLEAQSPDSPFMDILNDPSDESAIDGSPLTVISGNANVALSGNGLLALLSKLFFWKRNDLVVNTDSMYLGVKRKNNIQYFFDEGARVNHFKFFKNPNTVEAIDLAFKTNPGESIPGFKSVNQHEVPAADRALIEYGELDRPKELPSGKKPIVVLLPGIMGSNLYKNDQEIWLQYGRIITGGLINLDYTASDGIEANSVVKTSYYGLYKWLGSEYDVVVFPFDWRKPITECAAEFNDKVKELLKIGKPIKIIGHSLGGVLVRDFILAHNDTWKELNSSTDFRLIFLGSPLGGSHRILTVLFGEDNIIRKLSKIDVVHSKKTLLKLFSRFPGILGLLPLTTDPDNDYASLATWEKIREVFGSKDWPLPPASELNRFKEYRDNVLRQRDGIDYSRMVYIAGKDDCTPNGYYLDTVGRDKQVYFLYTAEGDQSVTWELGIPKQLEENKTVYFTRVTHGALANDPELFPGISDILSTGVTTRLYKHKPKIRGEEKIFRVEPEYDFDLSRAGLNRTLMGLGTGIAKDSSSAAPLQVSVSKGDLYYASYPVMAGHFMNDGILYAESSINQYLNQELSDKHGLGIYPGEIGSSAIFENPGKDFKGAVIIGLGEPDHLTSFQLTRSVEQSMLNYVLSSSCNTDHADFYGISSLIMACGYGGLSIETSIKAIIEGVQRANEKINRLSNKRYRTIKHLEFVELYANRALQCMHTLNNIISDENETYNILIEQKGIKSLLGVKKRIPLDSTAAWWNRISVKYREDDERNGALDRLLFSASTREAREEEQENFSNIPVINQFIKEASKQNRWSFKTAKTLFELLIPNPFKDQLKRKGNIIWIVDSKTASYPWELLQDDTKNAKPLCINAGMIRQLSISDYRVKINRVAKQQALVVADPDLQGFIGQLPGAEAEGSEVEHALTLAGYPVSSLIGSQAADIVRELYSEEYSIIHLAGHGVFEPDSPRKSGMVIGNEMFLSVFDIKQMTITPDLVFVNCCHLGLSSMADEKYYRDRYKLAANIGTELIRIGVKAVIAAGWAVNDDAAKDFSRKFYLSMFNGDQFGDAVRNARSHIYDKYPNSNTWGAYQCYGDPFFRLESGSKVKQTPQYIVPEEAEIDLDNLLNMLEMGRANDEAVMDQLTEIENAIEEKEDILKTAQVTEHIARIYQQLGLYEKAVERYGALLLMEKANFTYSSMEQYCNLQVKLYVKQGLAKPKENDEYYKKTLEVIEYLNVLKQSGNTAERNNLLGSAYKRCSMLAPDKSKRIKAYEGSYIYYQSAMKQSGNWYDVYSFTNTIILERLLILYGAKSGSVVKFDHLEFKIRTNGAAKSALQKMKEKIEANQKSNFQDLDYWKMVESVNIDVCLLFFIKARDIDAHWLSLNDHYHKVWEQAGSPAKKMAELEQLQFMIHGFHLASGKALKINYNIYNMEETEINLGKCLQSLRDIL